MNLKGYIFIDNILIELSVSKYIKPINCLKTAKLHADECFVLSLFENDKEISKKKLLYNGSIIEFKKGKKLKNINFYLTKDIAYEWSIDIKSNGILTKYYENGYPKSEIQYKDGKINGYVKEYNFQNDLNKEYYMVDDIKNGKYIEYYSKQNIKKECEYLNNELHGTLIEYNYNKEIWKKVDYLNGKKHGSYYEKHDNFVLKCIYNDDKFDGEYLIYKNSWVIFKCSFKNNVFDGTIFQNFNFKECFQKFILTELLELLNNVCDWNIHFNVSGTFKDGILVGSFTQSNPVNTTLKCTFDNNGLLHGPIICSNTKSLIKGLFTLPDSLIPYIYSVNGFEGEFEHGKPIKIKCLSENSNIIIKV